MSNPTTPFGWQMPQNTDLVTDLPADFEVFGQAVATSMGDLLGGASGYILSKASATDMDFTWIANDQGDITGVTATSPLTGGGTSGAITVGIQDASTSQKGSIQLSDSTSTTSSVLAATPTAVKSAYDLANAAIAKSTLTTAGDTLYRNAPVPARLAIGTAGQVLTVNSGATAPEWATAASTGAMTLITRSSFSNVASVTYDSVFSATYGSYLVVLENFYAATPADDILVKLRYSATTETTSYRAASLVTVYNSAAISTVLNSAVDSFMIADQSGSSTEPSRGHMIIPNAGVAGTFAMNGQLTNTNASRYYSFNCGNFQSRTYTGLLFQSSSSNITGTIAIYGMKVA